MVLVLALFCLLLVQRRSYGAAETDSTIGALLPDGREVNGSEYSRSTKNKKREQRQPHTVTTRNQNQNSTVSLRGSRLDCVDSNSTIIVTSTGMPIIATDSLSEKAVVSYKKVIECLKTAHFAKKVDMMKWRLPADAEAHYRDLLNATRMLRWAPPHNYNGYEGPWIENVFFKHFAEKPLSYFNGLIPIFIPWIDNQLLPEGYGEKYLRFIGNELKRLLRPDVIYFTVSQGDIGLTFIGPENPNLLVMSAGGYGHVPFPLIKSEIPLSDSNNRFKRDIGFYGNPKQSSRPKMLPEIKRAAQSLGLSYDQAQGSRWKQDMEETKYNLAPRGYGRSSFRYAEIIQMGRIPVFLYDDVPWIPYQGTKYAPDKIGFAAGLKSALGFPTISEVVQQIKSLDEEGYKKKLQLLHEARELYTYEGAMKQIEMFLQDPFGEKGGYLRCIKHPKTERCCDE